MARKLLGFVLVATIVCAGAAARAAEPLSFGEVMDSPFDRFVTVNTHNRALFSRQGTRDREDAITNYLVMANKKTGEVMVFLSLWVRYTDYLDRRYSSATDNNAEALNFGSLDRNTTFCNGSVCSLADRVIARIPGSIVAQAPPGYAVRFSGQHRPPIDVEIPAEVLKQLQQAASLVSAKAPPREQPKPE